MPLPTNATIFAYCERGLNPSFWAEPLNAVTNAGFILAALSGMVLLARRPLKQHSPWHYFFILNFIAIGVGSFLFHTMPNPQTAQADVIPIGIFMLSFLVFSMRRFVGLSWFWTAAALALFIASLVVFTQIQCAPGLFGFLDQAPPGARVRCLNGSLTYAPAMFAMWITGFILVARRHPAGVLVLAAGLIFLASLTLRTVDPGLCSQTVYFGRKLGTHFLWHLFNSITLFLLLVAAIKYSSHNQRIIPPRPAARVDEGLRFEPR
jgi:hypothetical protein